MAKDKTKQKQAYLKYFEGAKAKGTNKKNILTYGQWVAKQGTTGSRQHREGMKNISDADYKEIYRMIK